MEDIVKYVYSFLVICLMCYTTVRYGWYWIFLLFFAIMCF